MIEFIITLFYLLLFAGGVFAGRKFYLFAKAEFKKNKEIQEKLIAERMAFLVDQKERSEKRQKEISEYIRQGKESKPKIYQQNHHLINGIRPIQVIPGREEIITLEKLIGLEDKDV